MTDGETPETHTLVATAEESGERLDRALAKRLPFSRSELARFIADGGVTRNGEVTTRKAKLAVGDVIVIRMSPRPASTAIAEDLPLSILFEDEHLIIVNKAAGMVVHPAAGHPSGTLVNAVLHHAKTTGTMLSEGGDPLRPGIVHRLDKDTSGVMVVTKTVVARDGMSALFAAHDIERRYLAITTAVPTETTFDTLHGRHPRDRKKFSSRVIMGKRAVTHVEVLETLKEGALIACRLQTGRTHQIRVHLAEHGAAILADATYGKPPKSEPLATAARLCVKQALHAEVLGFVHPATKKPVHFEATPPQPFQDALAFLRP